MTNEQVTEVLQKANIDLKEIDRLTKYDFLFALNLAYNTGFVDGVDKANKLHFEKN